MVAADRRVESRVSQALRVTLRLCSPTWVTQPPMTCSTWRGAMPARRDHLDDDMAQQLARALSPDERPSRLPIGVRARRR